MGHQGGGWCWPDGAVTLKGVCDEIGQLGGPVRPVLISGVFWLGVGRGLGRLALNSWRRASTRARSWDAKAESASFSEVVLLVEWFGFCCSVDQLGSPGACMLKCVSLYT